MKNTLLAIACFFITAMLLLQVANAQYSDKDVPLEKRDAAGAAYKSASGTGRSDSVSADGAAVGALGMACDKTDGTCLTQTVGDNDNTGLTKGHSASRASKAAAKPSTNSNKQQDGKE